MKNVLYVEDSVTSQSLMRKHLDGLCELAVTASLLNVVTLLEKRNYALLIADFLFPEGDATELIREVRRTPRLSSMPIIVVSSSMDRLLLSEVLQAGANDALAKPLKSQEIRSLVATMLEKPYVRRLKHETRGVCCLQWQKAGRYFQHCPELSLTVEGATKDEVANRMQAALEAKARQGAALGQAAETTLITHLIKT
jgi:CheY-like chemotaxis protein